MILGRMVDRSGTVCIIGGEFSNQRFAIQCAEADIRPKGSRAFLAEPRIRAAKEAFWRLRLEYPDASGEYPLHLATCRLNKMHSEDGVPADQAAFGRHPRDITRFAQDVQLTSLDCPIDVNPLDCPMDDLATPGLSNRRPICARRPCG